MRYSSEYKRKCIEMYYQGDWPETPDGIKEHNFRCMIRRWVRLEEQNGCDVLNHKNFNRNWSPEEKLELVSRVMVGESYQNVAFSVGIGAGTLYQWVRKYKTLGYNGLVNDRKGRSTKDPKMKKINYNNPIKLEESEYEELIRLRAENEYIKTEIEVIKKEIALREEKEAALLKAKKQQSSKNSEKTDTN
jgi:transposase-like protein